MAETVTIGLLGCGRIGEMHAANICAHPKTRLGGVFDIYEPASQKVAERHGVRQCADPEEIFSDSSIDAVLIATATETHVDFIERSVSASKPTLCEKPIDLNLGRANHCRDRIAGSGVPVQLGFNRRFDPGHQACRARLQAGEIGSLRQVIITSRDPEMPPPGYCAASGGLFRDMTIHDFDLARFMLPEEPTEVFAMADRLIDPEQLEELGDHDTAMITMRTASGIQCFINNSRVAAYGYDQRVELLGADGMLQSDNRTPHSVKSFSAIRTEASEPYLRFFVERYSEAYMAELGAFADCVVGGAEPEVGFEDGRLALVLAEAAYRSLAEGRIVKVAEVDG